MATNREKYIDNLSNEELAQIIFDAGEYCDFCVHQGRCYAGRCESRGTCIYNITTWLSQEAKDEEEQTKIYNVSETYEKPEIIQITKKAWDDVLKRLDTLEEADKIDSDEFKEINRRLDKLEEEGKTKAPKDWNKNMTKDMRPMTQEDAEELVNKLLNMQKNWGIRNKEMNKTADQMFEELNYGNGEKNSEWIGYCKLSEDGDYDYDSIKINKKTYLYYKESVREKFDKRKACGITEAEDKAIHKKIEELQNEHN